MEKGELWPTMTSKSIKFFKFELDIHDYVRKVYTSANFHFNQFSGGFSPDSWYITVLWLFPGYTVFFLGHAPKSNPWMDFHLLWLIRRVFAQGRSFWGSTISEFIWGLKKNPKRAWIRTIFQAKPAKHKNRDMLQRSIRSTCNFRRMLGPSNTSRGWSDMTSYQIQDGGRPPFWKFKICNNSAADRPIFTKFCMDT